MEVLKGIPFVTIKGYASAYYYPIPLYRTMGDVDIYMDAESYLATKKRLIDSGYSLVSGKHTRHEPFKKNKVIFELHSEIKGIPNGFDGIKTSCKLAEDRVSNYLKDVVQTAVTVSTQQGKILIPDDFHHGLIMLLHIAGHMVNDGGIGLRHLCDWAVYVGKSDISQYQEKFKTVGLWTFACQLSTVSSYFLDLFLPKLDGQMG